VDCWVKDEMGRRRREISNRFMHRIEDCTGLHRIAQDGRSREEQV
jgi:hypothetical protein